MQQILFTIQQALTIHHDSLPIILEFLASETMQKYLFVFTNCKDDSSFLG